MWFKLEFFLMVNIMKMLENQQMKKMNVITNMVKMSESDESDEGVLLMIISFKIQELTKFGVSR